MSLLFPSLFFFLAMQRVGTINNLFSKRLKNKKPFGASVDREVGVHLLCPRGQPSLDVSCALDALFVQHLVKERGCE